VGPLDIPVVLGSIRRNRRSGNPARLIADRVAEAGHRASLIDLRELNLPLYDEEDASESHPSVVRFRAAMTNADAVILVTPEYNHSFTSAIKNAVDYLRPELRRKPVAVCGLSGGALGGVRAVEQLKMVMIELHAVPIRASVHFSDARTLFDPDGTLQRSEFVHRIDDMLAELAWYATALKWGRENVPIPQRR